MSIEYGTPVSKNCRLVKEIKTSADLRESKTVFFKHQYATKGQLKSSKWLLNMPFFLIEKWIKKGYLYRVKKCKKYSFVMSNKHPFDSFSDKKTRKKIIDFSNKQTALDIIDWCVEEEVYMIEFRINGVDFPTSTPEEIESLIKHISKLRK